MKDSLLSDFFHFQERGTNFRTEISAGFTTFITMSYIIFVQPAILSTAGMDPASVMVATCISSAVASILMGLLTNYPIALAPAMGHNVFFAVIICHVMGYSWQVALGAVFISGMLFFVLTLFNAWNPVIQAIPECLKYSIVAGLGFLIAFIGLQYGGLTVDKPGILVGLGDIKSPPVLLTITGLILTMGFMVRNIKGSILLGMILTTLIGLIFHIVPYSGKIVAMPPVDSAWLRLNISGAFDTGFVTIIFTFFFLDVFDTVGTLIGVTNQAGLLIKGRLPKANQAMMADAAGTVIGALLGTSTVTSYLESATGIAVGGRTGLTSIVTGLLFIAALFFSPLLEMIGGGISLDQATLYPIIAPALIVVGFLMMKTVTKIHWNTPVEALSAFVVILFIPLTFSITDGIGLGIITYTLLMLISGQKEKIHWLLYLISGLFFIRYFFI